MTFRTLSGTAAPSSAAGSEGSPKPPAFARVPPPQIALATYRGICHHAQRPDRLEACPTKRDRDRYAGRDRHTPAAQPLAPPPALTANQRGGHTTPGAPGPRDSTLTPTPPAP